MVSVGGCVYYPDLSKYEYDCAAPLEDVLNVGWLEMGRPYTTGPLCGGMIEKLFTVLTRCKTNVMRGIHTCDRCPDSAKIWMNLPLGRVCIGGDFMWAESHTYRVLLGNSELWVPSRDRRVIFAAPNLIYHYIKAHDYLPPSAFIEAVDGFAEDMEWNPDREFEERVASLHK